MFKLCEDRELLYTIMVHWTGYLLSIEICYYGLTSWRLY